MASTICLVASVILRDWGWACSVCRYLQVRKHITILHSDILPIDNPEYYTDPLSGTLPADCSHWSMLKAASGSVISPEALQQISKYDNLTTCYESKRFLLALKLKWHINNLSRLTPWRNALWGSWACVVSSRLIPRSSCKFSIHSAFLPRHKIWVIFTSRMNSMQFWTLPERIWICISACKQTLDECISNV